MKIINNFLDKKDFSIIESKMMGDTFPWYYNDDIVGGEDNFFQFTYTFIRYGKQNCDAEAMEIMRPLLNKIKFTRMERIKVNLLTKTEKIIEHGFHSDFPNVKTGIYYLNDCNGYTKFKDGKKIKSEKNKYIEFDSNLEHTGTTCTDKKRRVVINLNYL